MTITVCDAITLFPIQTRKHNCFSFTFNHIECVFELSKGAFLYLLLSGPSGSAAPPAAWPLLNFIIRTHCFAAFYSIVVMCILSIGSRYSGWYQITLFYSILHHCIVFYTFHRIFLHKKLQFWLDISKSRTRTLQIRVMRSICSNVKASNVFSIQDSKCLEYGWNMGGGGGCARP